MRVANIYLIRHGKVSGEAALYGHTDVNVASSIDQEIVKAFSQLSIPIDCIFTSPLQRCSHLAQQFAASFDVPLTSIEGLKEMNFGLYDGIAFDQLHQDSAIWQQLEMFWQNPVQHPLPKSELLTGFAFRVQKAWKEIVELCSDNDRQKNILVICHGGVIRMILAYLLNIDFRNAQWYTQLSIANGSLTSIEIKREQCRVNSIAKPLIGSGFKVGVDDITNNELIEQLNPQATLIESGQV